MASTSEGDNRDGNLGVCVASVFAFVLGACCLFWYYMPRFIPDWAQRGQFGDQFGALNTIFSGLAFGGVIYAILLQRRELELQRQELEATREELRRSAAAQEKSEAALGKQAKQLSRSAILASLNLLIEAYQRKMDDNTQDLGGSRLVIDTGKFHTYKEHRDQYEAHVQKILNELNREVADESDK